MHALNLQWVASAYLLALGTLVFSAYLLALGTLVGFLLAVKL